MPYLPRIAIVQLLLAAFCFSAFGQVKQQDEWPKPTVLWELARFGGDQLVVMPDQSVLAGFSSSDSYCLTLLSSQGKVVWSVRRWKDRIAATPVVGKDRRIFVLYASGFLYSLKPSGATDWWSHVIPSERGRRITSSAHGGQPVLLPLEDGGLIVAAGDLYEFSKSGKQLWRFHAGNRFQQVTILRNGNVRTSTATTQYEISRRGEKLKETVLPKDAGPWVSDSDGTIYRLGWVPLESSRQGYNQIVATDERGQKLWEYAKGEHFQGLSIGPGHRLYAWGRGVFAFSRTGQMTLSIPAATLNNLQFTRNGNLLSGCIPRASVCSFDPTGRIRWGWNPDSSSSVQAVSYGNAIVYVLTGSKLTALRDFSR